MGGLAQSPKLFTLYYQPVETQVMLQSVCPRLSCFSSGHEEKVQFTSTVGDLRKASDLETVLSGADVVFHVAALVDVDAFPNYKVLEEINVGGQSASRSEPANPQEPTEQVDVCVADLYA